MKICFIGIGSIAIRHILNLRTIYDKSALQIDVFRRTESSRLDKRIESEIATVYTSQKEMNKDYDAIFITNPTQKHIQALRRFKEYTNGFFIEKPLSNHFYRKTEAFDFLKEKMCYVACPLRYMDVIQYLKENINPKDVRSIRAISSSYLPDWRPGTDYRNTYSANREIGGGVSLDLIHEWDYLTYLFGCPRKVKVWKRQLSDLEMNVEDVAVYVAEYEDKLLELHLDYFGRSPIRKLELMMREDTMECDLIKGTIVYQKENRTIHFQQERDGFQIKELESFFKILNGEIENTNDLYHANRILGLAKGEIA